MPTKRNIAEMNHYQKIQHAVRSGADTAKILELCRQPINKMMAHDTESGPGFATSADTLMALWAVAARLNDVARENETLKRRLRRDNRRTSSKPQAELLKKVPEQQADVQEPISQPQPVFLNHGS